MRARTGILSRSSSGVLRIDGARITALRLEEVATKANTTILCQRRVQRGYILPPHPRQFRRMHAHGKYALDSLSSIPTG